MNINSRVLPALFILVAGIYGICWLLIKILPLLAYVESFLGFLILTYVIGASIRIFLRNPVNFTKLPTSFSIGGLSCDILLSLIVNLGLSSFLIRLYALSSLSLMSALLPLIFVLNSCSLIWHSLKVNQNKEAAFSIDRQRALAFIIPVLSLLASAIFFAFYFRNQTPFPAISGWDMNSSLAYVNWIVSNHGFSYFLIPAFPSPGIPYPAFFFFLVSSYHFVTFVPTFQIFWYSVFPLIFGYMLFIYFIALKFSKSALLSLTSSFIAFFTSTALAEVVRSPLYLTLDMVSQLLFLVIVVFCIYSEFRRENYVVSLLGALVLASFNFFVAVVVSPFLIWIVVGPKKLPFLGNGQKIFRISVLAIAVIALILLTFGSALMPAFSSFLSSVPFPLQLKISSFETIYPIFFWVLFAFAIASIAFARQFTGKTLSYLDILLYAALGLLLFFMPAWVTYRVEFYTRVFLAVIISGIAFVFDKRPFNHFFSISLRGRRAKIKAGTIASLCILIVTVSVMYPLFTNYSAQAYISKDEYNAASWLRSNTPPSAYIITDPSSGYVFRALAFRNASSYFILPDGIMPADSSTIYPTLDNATANFFASPTPSTWQQLTSLIPTNNAYIVITTRTVYWEDTSFTDYAITRPISGMNLSIIADKLEPIYFTEVYQSGTVEIYQPTTSLTKEQT